MNGNLLQVGIIVLKEIIKRKCKHQVHEKVKQSSQTLYELEIKWTLSRDY